MVSIYDILVKFKKKSYLVEISFQQIYCFDFSSINVLEAEDEENIATITKLVSLPP